ncbi:MAG: alpha/beta fold hydrolase [Pseudomonadota bacterium]
MKAIKKIVSTILIVYFCVVVGLYMAQRSLIYFPDKAIAELPTLNDITVEVLNVMNEDNLTLRGWFVKPQENKPTIVFFHGNASRHEASLWKSLPFVEEQGYGFLSVGYRGYGGNPGKPSEQGFYDDSRAFIDALKQSGIAEEDIILYGQSIGTGVAVQMATEYPNARAIILESPYTSLVDVAAAKYFFVPVRVLLKDRFDSFPKINQVKTPLLILHGKDDRIIPVSYGQKLFDAANEPKKLIALDGIGHNDIPREGVYEAAIQFMNSE